jgi:hypothetical protein
MITGLPHTADAMASASKRSMSVKTRASATVAVILCGCAAMLSLWSSSTALSRRVDERASIGRRDSTPLPSHRKLKDNLDSEEGLRESPGQLNRDPFRFYVRPVALSPPIKQAALAPPTTSEPTAHHLLPDPAIPWKFMGTVQRATMRWAVFSDCQGVPVPIAEGGSLEGRWRVTTIGQESVTLRSLEQRRIVLPVGGCQPR